MTPLHLVSRNGCLAAAKWLLDCGADANPQDKLGQAPLHFAVLRVHLEVARILLEHNAEVNARTGDGHTSLMMASISGSDAVRFLLDHNADAHVRNNKGDTALHFAARFGQLEASRILLERNAEVNPQNDEGLTPSHRASSGLGGLEGGNPDIVQLLLNHGADAQLCDLSGETASDVARGPRRQEIIRLFSQHAAR
ncbi:ankyrin repeat-containing domain protein [Lactarius deliciosus]|nr:ankyrin repeat-containing domain protein [Lactarius deliciosus]